MNTRDTVSPNIKPASLIEIAGFFVALCFRARYRADLMFFNKPIRIMRKLPEKLDTNKDAK
jgi:hypothetical protein